MICAHEPPSMCWEPRDDGRHDARGVSSSTQAPQYPRMIMMLGEPLVSRPVGFSSGRHVAWLTTSTHRPLLFTITHTSHTHISYIYCIVLCAIAPSPPTAPRRHNCNRFKLIITIQEKMWVMRFFCWLLCLVSMWLLLFNTWSCIWVCVCVCGFCAIRSRVSP